MIEFIHLLLGAALAVTITPTWLGFILALLSHYLLDLFPHWEYSIKNIEENKWNRSFPDLIKIFLDIGLGSLIVYLLTTNTIMAFTGGILGLLPDGLRLLNIIKQNFHPHKNYFSFKNGLFSLELQLHNKVNQLFWNNKNSLLWDILPSILIILISIFLLLQ